MSVWIGAKITEKHSDGSITVRVEPLVNGTYPAAGTDVLVKLRQPRNLKHHRLYWALMKLVAECAPAWNNAEAVHQWTKFRLGMYRAVEVVRGTVVIEWESTDFAAMDQTRFTAHFDAAIAEIAMETGIDPYELRAQSEAAAKENQDGT